MRTLQRRCGSGERKKKVVGGDEKKIWLLVFSAACTGHFYLNRGLQPLTNPKKRNHMPLFRGSSQTGIQRSIRLRPYKTSTFLSLVHDWNSSAERPLWDTHNEGSGTVSTAPASHSPPSGGSTCSQSHRPLCAPSLRLQLAWPTGTMVSHSQVSSLWSLNKTDQRAVTADWGYFFPQHLCRS